MHDVMKHDLNFGGIPTYIRRMIDHDQLYDDDAIIPAVGKRRRNFPAVRSRGLYQEVDDASRKIAKIQSDEWPCHGYCVQLF